MRRGPRGGELASLAGTPAGDTTQEKITMKRFIIEREIPGASELTQAQLAEISKTSNAAVASLGVPYTWVNSYVAGDKIYCVHEAEDAEDDPRARPPGGFPANKVTVVANEFGPQTAELVAG